MLRQTDVTSNLELVVRLALGRPVEFADPALRIPAITLELGRAALFFVQQSLFREGASHYQVLGLTPDATTDALRENHRLLIHLVHPDRNNQGVVWPESVAARVNRAYSVLRNAEARAAYDQQEAMCAASRDSGASSRAVFPPRRPVSSGAAPGAA
ncbi:MAG: J domain-containing protein [Betaproteobacteria bacterium]|nr:J domain-containing protein [Betaproteobacteria bacterium]